MTTRRSRYQGASRIVFSKDKDAKPYEKMYRKLGRRKRPLKQRLLFNERAIFAVILLSKEGDHKGNICAVTPPGTRAFLEDRLRLLIRGTENYGFTKAARRFKDAVKGWQNARPGFYLTSEALLMSKISAPIAKFLHRRQLSASRMPLAPIARHLIEATLLKKAYEPEDGEDLLFIPEWLDRKPEVSLDHPLRRRTNEGVKAAE